VAIAIRRRKLPVINEDLESSANAAVVLSIARLNSLSLGGRFLRTSNSAVITRR
jgi:hypothetical protein